MDKRSSTVHMQWFVSGLAMGLAFLFFAAWLDPFKQKEPFVAGFTSVHAIIPLLGSILGLRHALISTTNANSRWVLCPFSVGMLLWTFGHITWNVLYWQSNVAVQYPSLADVCYFSNLLLWFFGITVIYMILDEDFNQVLKESIWFLGPGGLFIYWVATYPRGGMPSLDDPTDLIKFGLDVGYPGVGLLNCALLYALLTGASRKKLTSEMKSALLLMLIGMALNFISDCAFTLTTSFKDTNRLVYRNGNFVDFGYFLAFYFLTLATLKFPVNETSKSLTSNSLILPEKYQSN